MRRSGEARLIDRIVALARRARVLTGPGVTLGIGHDCAVLRPRPGEEVAWHVDDQVEDVHFRRRWASLEDVGWKAAGSALSDLAAVGARPLGAQLALQLPRDLAGPEVLALVRGFVAALARAGRVPLVGGNVAARPAGTGVSLSVSVLGAVARGRALRRDGARPSLELYATGLSGLARIGLLLLEGGHRPRRGPAAAAVARLLRPEPRLGLGQAVAALPAAVRPRAATDTSDGLGAGARLLAAGAKATAVIEEARLDLAGLARAANSLGRIDLLATALEGGEDYELLVAAPGGFGATRPGRSFTRIGRLERGSARVVVERAGGGREVLGETGYAHR